MPTKTKQCEYCGKAKTGEPLFSYNGKILCAYCIAALMTETHSGVVSAGNAGGSADGE
jgi:uncharacterized Zn finger protein (UPF0148 family)